MLSTLLEEKPICPILKRKVEDYFRNEENKRKFEEWYRKKYGKEYQWK